MTRKFDLKDYTQLYLEPTCDVCKRETHERHWSWVAGDVACGRCHTQPRMYEAWKPPVPRKKPAPSELMKELSAAASAISKLRHKISVLEEEPEAEA